MTSAFIAISPVFSHASRPSTQNVGSTLFVHKTATKCRSGYAVRCFSNPVMKIGILFSTVTGNTEEVASMCKEYLGSKADEPRDISDIEASSIGEYEALVVGAPTWNTGADSERTGTDWDEFLYGDLDSIDLNGVPVAVFGLGDGVGYGDNFCDAIEEMHDGFQKKGAKMIGYTSPDECDFSFSKSVRGGKFLGLAIDHVNASDATETRVKCWCEQLEAEAGV